MSKILFLDDRTKRINYALKTYVLPAWELTLVVCIPEALRLMCNQEWNVISMDNDLNGHDFQDIDSPACGMEIVRYLEKCGGWHEKFSQPDFLIHSSNHFAAHLMIVRLGAMGFNVEQKLIIYPA